MELLSIVVLGVFQVAWLLVRAVAIVVGRIAYWLILLAVSSMAEALDRRDRRRTLMTIDARIEEIRQATDRPPSELL